MRHIRRLLILLVSGTVLLAACSVSPITQSRDLWTQGRYEEAVELLRDAAARDPGDRRLVAEYHRQRDRALSQIYVAADNALTARKFDDAQGLYERALRLDPAADRAKDGLARVQTGRRLDQQFAEAAKLASQGKSGDAESLLRRIVAEDPDYHPARRMLQHLRERQSESGETPASLRSALATPVSVEFRDTQLRNVFEVLSRAGGLNFVFDHDVKTDTKVTIFVRNNAIDDVLKVLLSTNGLARKVLNENTMLVYPNTPPKLKEYQDLVVRTFYLANAEAKQVETLLKTLVHVKDVYTDDKINTVVVRDTADAVRLAERVVQSVDLPEAEVMLELSVIELSHTRALDLGIQLPGSITRGSSNPIGAGASTSTGATSGGSIPTSNMSSLITTIPNPLLMANLSATDTDADLLANPRIRVKNREKAKVLIGEKLPVITSTAVQNAGVASSVSYIDVGLKLEVEPQVFLDDEVGIKLLLEVNSNLGEVTVGNSTTGVTTAYQIGTRSAQTTLRLHDGETQVLAGLINDNDNATWNKVPGLSDLPVLGRLFSNENSNHEKTEIVLLVTPRIVRNLGTPDGDPLLMPAGTEAAVGAAPIAIGRTAPNSMALQGQGGAAAGAPAAAAVEAPLEGPASAAAPAALAPAAPVPAAAPAPVPASLPPAVLPNGPAQGSFPPAPGSTDFMSDKDKK